MLSCQWAWFDIILSMVPLAVLFLFWTRYKCWYCAVLFLGKMQVVWYASKFWKIPGLVFSVWNFRVIVPMVSYLSHRWYVLIKTYLVVCNSAILYIFKQTLPELTRIHWLSLRILALGSIHRAVLYERKIEACTLGDAERFHLVTLISCVDLFNQNSMNSEECSKTFPSLVKTQTAVHSLTSFLWWFPQVFYSWRVLCSMSIWSHPAHLYTFSFGKNVINNFPSCSVDPKP